MSADKPIRLQNEFAGVMVTLDSEGNGPRLRIEDLESGVVAFFDPIEIASLCFWEDSRREHLVIVGPYRGLEDDT